MKNDVNRLQIIIDDLLDMSKIESGIFLIIKSWSNIVKIVDMALEQIQPIAQNKKLKILKKYYDTLLEWNFDVNWIQRVINVFLSNAVKFSFDDSEIIIDLKVVKCKEIKIPHHIESLIYLGKNYLLFSVQDKGIGIEVKYQDKIFEKLFQIEDSLTRKFQGTGIGLSIAKAIVEAHDGIIWAESEGLNEGSVFYVLLPE